MCMDFQKILVVYKQKNHEARKLAQIIATWLDRKNLSVILEEAGNKIKAHGADCAIVLGGDGTLLGLARKFANSKIPLYGINFGRVGFLCGSDVANWSENLERLLSGQLSVKKYVALYWQLIRDNALINCGYAANDVVLSRGTLARLICVNIEINNNKMGILRGDGLICYTPLGSSGYNLSAGGPLLYPELNAVGFTPVCPFLPNVTPLIFSGDIQFEFYIEKESAPCFVTIDGQEGQKLECGDKVLVSALANAMFFLGEETQFFNKLKTRGMALENVQQFKDNVQP